MTQAQSPYESSSVNLYQEPERTSVMAILSLVFGILGCCGGVTGLLSIPLGIFGLIGISRSKGRVGGTGFGIAGIILGVLTIALWIGLFFGVGGAMSQAMGQFGTNVESILTDIEADRFDEARAQMTSPAADVPDEAMIAFRDAYRSTLGNYVGPPAGMGDWWSGYAAMGQTMGDFQGSGTEVPMPMRFDSGWGLVIYVMDPDSADPQGLPRAAELVIIDASGNEYRLPPAGAVVPPAAPGDAESDVDDVPAPEDETPELDPADEPDEGP